MLSSTLRGAVSGAVIACALAGWMVPASAQDDQTTATEQVEDRVVAEVDGEQIRQSEVVEAIQGLPPQVRQMPPQMLMPLVADQLVTGRLIARQGYDADLQDPDAVKRRVADAERRTTQEAWLGTKNEDGSTAEAEVQANQERTKFEK